MSQKEYVQKLLEHLGYTPKNDIWSFTFQASQATITVDMKQETIHYPTDKGLIVNEKQTCNFSASENFVVLECVHQLLLKGYRPEHIELERRWPLGHSAKGGRADICVKNESGTATLFIIECKTYGKEYNKALENLRSDGGQLFSYLQQDKSTRWLCLYASRLEDNELKHQVTTICSFDDEQILKLHDKDANTATYLHATTAEQSFTAWSETYERKTHGDLIFSDDTVAYSIGVQPLRKRDLKEFNPQDKVVNQFEEILRHNNVSDKENAFNKLLALFICKLVDELQKGEDDIVEFQYQQGTDTYETLQDRLQRLHKEGMDKFMREEVFYVSNEYPQELFERYKGGNRTNAIKELQDTFRKLKFYSNNDFAFKEVHNEELFLQNGKILVEMVRLFENYRITYKGKHQFLGDLFEQLLNKGFKQNEGQFFTPTPITRFIWEALPLTHIIKSSNGELPKVIDYACGAGHFLTEGIEAIAKVTQQDDDREWVKDTIYGIEKDYRLARVSKIALFMNGAGEGHIIFGDGLDNDKTRGIENGTFSILVANPPYSVKSFKSHLKLKNNELQLLNRISNDGGEIEVLFVERIAQLLKPGACAAVILPSSILSNNSNSYIGAREVLLQNFLIKAIVQFGSKTFGATGTNTVALFLRKHNEPPKPVNVTKDSVTNIFNNEPAEDWPDQDILSAYLEHISVDEELYRQFINQEATLETLRKNDHFKTLVDVFVTSSRYKELEDKKVFKKMDTTTQSARIQQAFYKFALDIEREKVFYFALVKDQKTLIATAPNDNAKQKQFLGYDWSNRKGNEGIQIALEGGQLYDPQDPENKKRIAPYIRAHFNNKLPSIDGSMSPVLKLVDTSKMLNFASDSFTKAISLTELEAKNTILVSKYKTVPLNSVADIASGNTAPKDEALVNGTIPFFRVSDLAKDHINSSLTTSRDMVHASINNLRLFKKGSTLLPKSGQSVYLNHRAMLGVDGYVVSHLAVIKSSSKAVLDKYIFLFLLNVDARKLKNASGYASLNLTDLSKIQIPVPPVEVQNQIITACEEVEQRYQETRMQIEEYKKQIQDIFERLDVAKTAGGGGGGNIN